MSLTFDEATHTYRWRGQLVPSVTKIIEPMYDWRFVKEADLERARIKGAAVDKTIRLAEAGRLDEEATALLVRDGVHVGQMLLAHLAQWRAFKRDCQFQPIQFGEPMYCEEYGFAGTYDVLGKTAGEVDVAGIRLPEEDAELLIDIKTGQHYAPHHLQTAGYKEALVQRGAVSRKCRRASLYLDETSYNLVFHTDINDRAVFLGLITQYFWRAKHGL